MPSNGRGIAAVTVAAVAWLLALTLGWVHVDVGPPAQRINIRWAPSVSAADRIRVERELGLGGGKQDEVRTWSYLLRGRRSRSRDNIVRMVSHPWVEDTAHLDRTTFRVQLDRPDMAPWLRSLAETDLLPLASLALALWGFSALWLRRNDVFHLALDVWKYGTHVWKYVTHVIPTPTHDRQNDPLLFWVLAIFSTAYVFFFLYPVFLNSAHVMTWFADVPAGQPPVGIGMDARLTIGFSRAWLVHGTPYVDGNSYPPLATLVFAPLVRVPFEWAYALITAATVLSFSFIAFVFPLCICQHRRVSPLLMLICVTGLFSYGFRFEVERGQFNLIAMCLCCAAIVLYHHASRYRPLAYVLFTIAAQLKVYPFVFVLMLISNWRSLRENVLRLALVTSVSIALLFVLGPSIFVDFVEGTIAKLQPTGEYSFIGPMNHSIKSWVVLWSQHAAERNVLWPTQHVSAVQLALVASVLACLCVIVMTTHRAHQDGIDTTLLLGCTLCALLIPAVSHDYTLPLLTGPFAALLMKYEDVLAKVKRRRWHLLAPILVCSAAYVSLLFSRQHKPTILAHNMPALIAMLLSLTWLSLVTRRLADEPYRVPQRAKTTSFACLEVD